MSARERGILMTGGYVRAVLEDRKTQTRRPVKLSRPLFAWQKFECADGLPGFIDLPEDTAGFQNLIDAVRGHPGKPCPFGKVGDRLWVRETWAPMIDEETLRARGPAEMRDEIVYFADYPTPESIPGKGFTWRPSLHMPRWASRITLEVTDVRCERVQTISEDDAKAEGIALPVSAEDCPPGKCRPVYRVPVPYEGPMTFEHAYRWEFSAAWDSIYRKTASWESNPWVWVVAFKRAP